MTHQKNSLIKKIFFSHKITRDGKTAKIFPLKRFSATESEGKLRREKFSSSLSIALGL
jgi:hypothetical protein